jgi:tRNA(Arg) A34 adenosine deaminase TadA
MASKSASYYLNIATIEALKSLIFGEMPVGSVLVNDNNLISLASNMTRKNNDATRHAEFEMIQTTVRVHGYCGTKEILFNSDLFVSNEPCIMCTGLLKIMNLRKIIYGISNYNFGGFHSVLNTNNLGCNKLDLFSFIPTHHKHQNIKEMKKMMVVEILKDFYTSINLRGINTLAISSCITQEE